MRRQPKKSAAKTIDVQAIMVEIEKKAKARALKDDLKRLNQIDLKAIPLSQTEATSSWHKPKPSDEENLGANLTYINENYLISDKYNFVKTHRKRLIGKMANAILIKLFLAVKIFIDKIIVAQEIFNVKVVRLFNRISKDIAEVSHHLEKQQAVTHDLGQRIAEQAKLKDGFSGRITKVTTDLSDLSSELSGRIDEQQVITRDLTQRVEEQSKLRDSFSGHITKVTTDLSDLSSELSGRIDEQNTLHEAALKKVKQEIQYPRLDIDYKALEDLFRGDQNEIQRKQRQYIRFFHESKDVMDIGCGRGEFIEVLHANGIGAFGVEVDESMVRECQKKNLNVVHVDAVSYLKEQLARKQPDAIDGIFSAQVIEHLHMDYLIEMLKLCYQILMKDKFIILETINIKSLATLAGSVYLDPTHVKPIHPDTLKFILESCGFKIEGFIFSGEFKADEKLKKVPEETAQDTVYNSNIERLNELLFAPQDYAIIAQK